MEKMGEWKKRSLINELTQGQELARQLLVHLNAPSSSDGTKEFLVHKIEASYEKALSMVNCNANPAQPTGGNIRMLESPPTSRCGSPPSEDSHRRRSRQPELIDASKKRKSSQPRWTQRVRVTPEMALKESLDDGFNWRKYGQKDIYCSKYPRGYYRCIHRSVGGCLATKQVQRSDDDPTIFDITYIGTHTCTNGTSNPMSLPGQSDEKKQEHGTPSMEILCHNQKQSSQDLLGFQKDLNVKNKDLDSIPHRRHQTYTSFPYTSSTSNVVFSSSPFVVDNTGVGNVLPCNFALPVISGTNFSFRTPDHQTGVSDDYKMLQGAAATSATNSPVVGLDFPFGNSQLDQNFTFDNNGFFPQQP